MRILVTGGAGFIGSNFLNCYLPSYPEHTFINMDALTYAANLSNLEGTAARPNYRFERGDIADYNQVREIFEQHNPDLVVHFAAESHVDRSIVGPGAFVRTNITGTFHLLEACREFWGRREDKLFHHISTDEVYGSLGPCGRFTEKSPYAPSSPYSASKAAADHLVRAYGHTYGLPVVITNCSNNYGPFQFPEKLIPLIILNALEGRPLPVYGNGENVRDWLFVEDHCAAIWTVIHQGKRGETYNIGGNNEWKNIDIVHRICEVLGEETQTDPHIYKKLITFVQDRPGHDLRYAIDDTKIKRELGWRAKETFATGLRTTIRWYLDNQPWVESVKTGDYRKWLDQNYRERLTG